VAISSPARKAAARSLFSASASVNRRVEAVGGWKKQGRRSPFASITAETQGALQAGERGGIPCRRSRKRRAIRRSLDSLSRIKWEAKSAECFAMSRSISDSSS
jgi:hypothetical protein